MVGEAHRRAARWFRHALVRAHARTGAGGAAIAERYGRAWRSLGRRWGLRRRWRLRQRSLETVGAGPAHAAEEGRCRAECAGRTARRDPGSRWSVSAGAARPRERRASRLRCRSGPAGRDPEGLAREGDLDRTVRIRAVRPIGDAAEPVEGGRRGVAVGVAGARGHDRELRMRRFEERLGARGPGAVVRNLEQVDAGHPSSKELRIDALLDVTHEQEPLRSDLPEEHDRDVVDRCPAVGRPLGYPVGVRPEDAQPDRVERQPIARRQPSARGPAVRECLAPGLVSRPRPHHARLVDAPDAVPLEHQGQPGDVVLVRVAEHEDVDPAVPWRQAFVQRDQEPRRIRSAIDHEPATPPALDQDPVALADIEHHDPSEPVRSMDDHEPEPERRDDEGSRRELREASAGTCPAGVAPDPARAARATAGRDRGPSRASRSPASCPDTREPSIAVPRGRDDQHRGSRGRQAIPRRCELQARERQPGAEPDNPDHRRVQAPRREPDERRDHRRQAGVHQHAHHQRERSRRHRRRHQRHHDQVDRRRDEREATEHDEHDGRRGRLGGERDAEDLRDPAPEPRGRRARQPLGQAGTPGDDSRGGQDGQPEACVKRPFGVDEEQSGDRPAERGRGRARTPELAGEQRNAGHDAGANHRWRWPDEGDIRDDGDRREDRPAAPLEPAGERAERRRDDRDIPAADRNDVAGAGDREGAREIAVHTIPEPDQHARGESGLGFGDGPFDSRSGGSANAFERSLERAGGRKQLQRLGPERTDRADLGEVRAVLVLGRRPDPARHLDAIARDDGRVPGQRRRDASGLSPVQLEQDRRRSRAGSGSADRLDSPKPRSAAGRDGR